MKPPITEQSQRTALLSILLLRRIKAPHCKLTEKIQLGEPSVSSLTIEDMVRTKKYSGLCFQKTTPDEPLEYCKVAYSHAKIRTMILNDDGLLRGFNYTDG